MGHMDNQGKSRFYKHHLSKGICRMDYMSIRILLIIVLILGIQISIMAEEPVETPCNIDKSCIEIYSRAIKQAFETLTSAKKIVKTDIEMFPVKTKSVVSSLNKEFDTDIFGKACFIGGKVYSYKYHDPSFIEFGIYQLSFKNEDDVENALKIIKNANRKHFRTKKSRTIFSWHRAASSLFIIFEEILVGHESLEQLN